MSEIKHLWLQSNPSILSKIPVQKDVRSKMRIFPGTGAHCRYEAKKHTWINQKRISFQTGVTKNRLIPGLNGSPSYSVREISTIRVRVKSKQLPALSKSLRNFPGAEGRVKNV